MVTVNFEHKISSDILAWFKFILFVYKVISILVACSFFYCHGFVIVECDSKKEMTLFIRLKDLTIWVNICEWNSKEETESSRSWKKKAFLQLSNITAIIHSAVSSLSVNSCLPLILISLFILNSFTNFPLSCFHISFK